MASAVICLSKGQRFNFSMYFFDSLVRNVDSSSKFYMYPRFIQLIIQVQVVDLSSHTTRYISPALTQKKVGTSQRIESSEDEENVLNQGRKSVDIEEGIEIVDDQQMDVQEDSEFQEVVEVVNAAKLITELQEEEESFAQAKDAQVTDDQPKDAPAKGIQYIRRYHGYKKKPQSESQARK
nr:hypothetical protein [Tanacetum cinerariifolium]